MAKYEVYCGDSKPYPTDSIVKARKYAGGITNRLGKVSYIYMNGEVIAQVWIRRADRFNGKKWVKRYAYYCAQDEYKKPYISTKYYEFDPKTGKIIRTDSSIKYTLYH